MSNTKMERKHPAAEIMWGKTYRVWRILKHPQGCGTGGDVLQEHRIFPEALRGRNGEPDRYWLPGAASDQTGSPDIALRALPKAR